MQELRKIRHDNVISDGDLVGVYFDDTNGVEPLMECSKENADRIVKLWNEVIAEEQETLYPPLKAGDILIYIAKDNSSSVLPGATAIFERKSDKYIYVTWIRQNPLCRNQSDGGYFEHDFIKLRQEGLCLQKKK